MSEIQNKLFGDTIKFLITGGGYISSSTIELINGIGYPLYNGYGMSEISITSVELRKKIKYRNISSIGKPLPTVQYKIENNNLYVKGKSICSRIITKNNVIDIDHNDWFFTNDLVTQDKKGYYYIVGRNDDVVVSQNGEKINPDLIEKNITLLNLKRFCILGLDIDGSNKLTFIGEINKGLSYLQIQKIIKELEECINDLKNQNYNIEKIFLTTDKIAADTAIKVSRSILIKKIKNNEVNLIPFINFKENNIVIDITDRDRFVVARNQNTGTLMIDEIKEGQKYVENFIDNFFCFKDTNPNCKKGEEYKAFIYNTVYRLETMYSEDGIHFRRGYDVETPGKFDTLNTCLFDKNINKFEVQTLLSGKYDSNNAIITLHPGAGGTESQDWAEMLYRMYSRWANKNGYTIKELEYLEGDEAGIKSVTALIVGENAYGYLKCEHGVHRLVRISPFDAGGRRHTSFASLEVLPEITEDVEIEINPNDLRIDTYRASGAGGQHINKTESAVRAIHGPTGIIVACQDGRSQHANKEKALAILAAKVQDFYVSQVEEKVGAERKLKIGSGERSEKIRIKKSKRYKIRKKWWI